MKNDNYIKASREMILSISGSQEKLIREVLSDMEFAVVEITEEDKEKKGNHRDYGTFFRRFRHFLHGDICGIRDIGSGKPYLDARYYLCMGRSRSSKDFKEGIEHVLKHNTKLIILSDIEELLSFAKNKEFIFRVNSFDSGNFEHDLVNAVFSVDFKIQRSEMNIMNDDNYDVRIYLQEISDKKEEASGGLKLISAKTLDITNKMIAVLENESKGMSFDETDFTCEYDTEEGEIMGHYFLTRFHSNDLWDYNPVNILNFRFSAFVLPGFISAKEAESLLEEEIVTGEDGRKYVLDSIHFTTDICYSLEAFEKLMELHYADIAMA